MPTTKKTILVIIGFVASPVFSVVFTGFLSFVYPGIINSFFVLRYFALPIILFISYIIKPNELLKFLFIGALGQAIVSTIWFLRLF